MDLITSSSKHTHTHTHRYLQKAPANHSQAPHPLTQWLTRPSSCGGSLNEMHVHTYSNIIKHISVFQPASAAGSAVPSAAAWRPCWQPSVLEFPTGEHFQRGRHIGSSSPHAISRKPPWKRCIVECRTGGVGVWDCFKKSPKHPIKLMAPSPEPVDLHINQRQQSNSRWRSAISDCLHACTVSPASPHSLTQTQTHLPILYDVMNPQGFSRFFFLSSLSDLLFFIFTFHSF